MLGLGLGLNKGLSIASRTEWTPLNLNTVLWLDASDESTITESEGAVSKWDDKSGNNYHAIQTEGTRQPTTGVKTINTLNAIDFLDDTMTISETVFGATIENAFVIAVYKIDSISRGVLFSLSGFSQAANRWQTHAPWEDGDIYFDVSGQTGNNRLQEPLGANAGDNIMVSWYASNTEGKKEIFKNGGLTPLAGNTTTGSVNFSGTVWLASHNDIFQDTSIGEFIIINGTVSSDERQKLEGYLAWKWGLVEKLPALHPYKASAPTV